MVTWGFVHSCTNPVLPFLLPLPLFIHSCLLFLWFILVISVGAEGGFCPCFWRYMFSLLLEHLLLLKVMRVVNLMKNLAQIDDTDWLAFGDDRLVDMFYIFFTPEHLISGHCAKLRQSMPTKASHHRPKLISSIIPLHGNE